MIDNNLRLVIDGTAGRIGLTAWDYRGESFLPGEWFEGLFLHESAGGDPTARRYEPHQDRAADADVAGRDDGAVEDDASYGLGQVMGYTARDALGLPGTCKHGDPILYNYSFLFRPVLNIAISANVLSRALTAVTRRHPQAGQNELIERALCNYNGGATGDAIVNGDYRVRVYVDNVAVRAKVARENRRLLNWEMRV